MKEDWKRTYCCCYLVDLVIWQDLCRLNYYLSVGVCPCGHCWWTICLLRRSLFFSSDAMGVFGTAVTHRAVRYVYRGARAAVPKTQVLVYLCSFDAVCEENNHRTVGAIGVIVGLFSPPPQETRSQTRP